jgi:hypothetical protein
LRVDRTEGAGALESRGSDAAGRERGDDPATADDSA